ncbi:kinase domain-containing protein [Fusarium globosum]|uniref:Kinase domain-containing protein n=1 Tax=Fusarium globosum TaxID=78864 RepID=A0A8H6CYV9_9HYPO|nr:kinase domain-containing protein [Fusarium globosum]
MKRKAPHPHDELQAPTAQSNIQHPQARLRHYGFYQRKESVSIGQETLEKIISIRFKGSRFWFDIAQRTKNGEMGLVIVRVLKHFSRGRANIYELLNSAKERNHRCFVNIKALSPSNHFTSVIYEYLPVSLAELSGDPELGQQDLAAILAQILKGLSHIHENSLTYFKMRSCNILIDFGGVVKLWFTEFEDSTLDAIRDLKALGTITQVLMQGYENVPPKIDDTARWSEECQTFFFSIISTTEIDAKPLMRDQGFSALRISSETTLRYGIDQVALDSRVRASTTARHGKGQETEYSHYHHLRRAPDNLR